jgi:hypothetical protein
MNETIVGKRKKKCESLDGVVVDGEGEDSGGGKCLSLEKWKKRIQPLPWLVGLLTLEK